MRTDANALVTNALVNRVRAVGTSFYWAIRMLPPDRRAAMAALYLYCRAVDDIADGPGPEAAKRAGLEAWRAWVRGDGPCPDGDVGATLEDARFRFDLPEAPLLAIIDGVSMDLPPGLVAPPRAVLEQYCAGVAGAVGLVSVRIFGASGPDVDAFALTTGEALQFTNILRDVQADAAVGRLYLPRETLQAAGVPITTPQAVVAHPALPRVCAALADEAEARYTAALHQVRALRPDQRRALRPAVVMLALYRGLLERLRRRGWEPDRLSRRPAEANRLSLIGTVLRYRLFDA